MKVKKDYVVEGKSWFCFSSPKVAPWKLLHCLMSSYEISQGKVLQRGEVNGTVITVLCVSSWVHIELKMWQRRLLSLPGKWYEYIMFQQRTQRPEIFR